MNIDLSQFDELFARLQPPVIKWSKHIDPDIYYQLRGKEFLHTSMNNIIIAGYIPVDEDHEAWQ